MGEGQQDSIWQWFIRPHVCRKIENQTAKVTLKIIRIVCMDMWLQLFHVELHHGMLTRMLLSQMQIQLSCVVERHKKCIGFEGAARSQSPAKAHQNVCAPKPVPVDTYLPVATCLKEVPAKSHL